MPKTFTGDISASVPKKNISGNVTAETKAGAAFTREPMKV
jgi:hypothetical protein